MNAQPNQPFPCPHCGQAHAAGTEYCPVTGLPIFYEEPVSPAAPSFWEKLEALLDNRAVIAAAIGLIVLLGLGALGAVLYLFLGPEPAPQTPDFSVLTVEAAQAQLTQSLDVTAVLSPTPGAADTAQPQETAAPEADNTPWQACADGAYLSRVRVGATVSVSNDPPLPNRVRSSAGTDGSVLGYLQPGEKAEVIDGPACVSQWVWWRVRAADGSLEGWTAEGDQDGYWLVPGVP